MRLIKQILPVEKNKRIFVSVGLTILISGLLTLWGIYGIGQYGIALFIFTPILIGAMSTILYGYGQKIKYRESWRIAFFALLIYSIGLLVFPIEGLICIAMASPIGLLLTWVGSLIGYAIVNKTPNNAPTAMLILIGIIPTMAFIEKIMIQP